MKLIEIDGRWGIIEVERKLFWCILSSLTETDGIVYQYDENTSRIAVFGYDYDIDVKYEVDDIIAYWEAFKWV